MKKKNTQFIDDRVIFPRASATWLINNTSLTKNQIRVFTGLTEIDFDSIKRNLESEKEYDCIEHNQLTKEEIKRCEEDPTLQLKLNKSLPVKITKLYLTKKQKNLLPGAIKWLKLALPSIKDEIIMSTLNITKTQLQAQLKRCIMNDVEPINPLECKLCLFTDLPDEIKNILKT